MVVRNVKTPNVAKTCTSLLMGNINKLMSKKYGEVMGHAFKNFNFL